MRHFGIVALSLLLFLIMVPQTQAQYACTRCSTVNGCQMTSFSASDIACTNPVSTVNRNTDCQCPTGSGDNTACNSCAGANMRPVGNHDGANGGSIWGWTCDPDNFGQAINVRLYTDKPGELGGTLLAEIPANGAGEAAIGSYCGGTTNHRFTYNIPWNSPLLDGGTHYIYAYGVNIGTGVNTALWNSPKVISGQYPPTPVVTLTANPNSVAYGGTTQLTWSSQYASSCTTSWSGAGKPASGTENSPALYSNTNFTVTCSNSHSSNQASVSVNVAAAPLPPTVDIKANGNDGPITIAYNTAATISWTSSNASSCSVSPTGWSGISNGGISTGNLTSGNTYTINCTGPGGNKSDAVTVNVSALPPPSTPTPTPLPKTPGLVYTGVTNSDIGAGSGFSLPGWIVGGASKPFQTGPDVLFAPPPNRTTLATEYNFLLSKAQQSRQTATNPNGIPFDDTTFGDPGPHNCDNTCFNGLGNGVYVVKGDLFLNDNVTYNVNGNKNIILLVDGNVTVGNGDPANTTAISVDVGSTFLIAAKGSITFEHSVGLAPPSYACTTDTDVAGIFSADSNIIVAGDGSSGCTDGVPDKMLRVGGNLIVNADLNGEEHFINGRDLCGYDSQFPSVRFLPRPDFILNMPEILRETTNAFKEITP